MFRGSGYRHRRQWRCIPVEYVLHQFQDWSPCKSRIDFEEKNSACMNRCERLSARTLKPSKGNGI